VNEAAEAPVFNPLEEGFIEWPYDQYAKLRVQDPVHRSDLLHGWVLTRYDDVSTVLRDPTISVEIENATPTPITQNEQDTRESRERDGRTVVLLDDPEHAMFRKLLARPFRPRELGDFEAMIHRRVHERLDSLRDEGRTEIDVIEDFSYPLPVEIFCEMLGFAHEDSPQFRYWVNCVARSLDPMVGGAERDELDDGIDEMYAYLEVQAEEKRQNPTDDVLSQLVHAEEDGFMLSHGDLIAQLVTLYVAGHEPTSGLVGNGLLALLKDRPQFERLRTEPDLLRNAVSELLRYDGPNQFVRRVAMVDMDLGGTTVPAGDVIYASPGAANRDPTRWGDTADQVVVDREDAGQHLQFGAGVHSCLGSNLGRMQAEVMFRALFDRLEDIELAGEPEWSTRMTIRGLKRLPVKCRAIV
jgi:cytochrome P450